MEQPQDSGPVSAQAAIDIAADEREIWTVLADIAAWPTWNPAVREAVFDADLEAGARFRFSTAFGSLKCQLTEVDAPRTFAWKGRLLTLSHRQVWHIEPAAGHCHVSTDASISGLSARLFKARLNERLHGDVEAMVQLLKLEAEVRSAEEAQEETRGASEEGKVRPDG